jgi:dGTPase
MEEIASGLGLLKASAGSWARHPLVFLVEAADDICYAIIDLEDALEVGILVFREVESILLAGLDEEDRSQCLTISEDDIARRLGYLRGKVVDYLVIQAIKSFFKNEDKILAGQFDGDLISDCEENARAVVGDAKRLAFEKVFQHPRKTQIEIGAYSIIDVLLRSLCEAYLEMRKSQPSFKAQRVFDLLGVDAPRPDGKLYDALIRITDFVSGSTDKYAAQLSRRLAGIEF